MMRSTDNDEELSLCDVLSTRTNQPKQQSITHTNHKQEQIASVNNNPPLAPINSKKQLISKPTRTTIHYSQESSTRRTNQPTRTTIHLVAVCCCWLRLIVGVAIAVGCS